MSAPNLDITVQPTDGTRLYYLPIAAKAKGEKEYVKIVLRLRIKNPTASDLTLRKITFAYPGSSPPDSEMQGVKIAFDPQGSENLDDGVIKAGTTATWSNGVVDLDVSEAGENSIRNDVYLEAPAPSSITIKVYCEGYTDPKTLSMDLIPYIDPTGSGALRMPISNVDLDYGEYLVTSAKHWANGGANGTQIYAHDIGVQAKVNGSWTPLNDGVSNAKNSDYRIWGKPLRALADGVVKDCADNYENNEFPGAERPEGTPGSGNFMKIQHGNITVIYCHLQKGSIPDALKSANANVKAGDKIGLAGNSGRSDGPHVHIEGEDTTTGTLRGLPFRAASVLDRDLISADQTGPWVTLTADGICQNKVAIRPGWRFGPMPHALTELDMAEIVAEVFGGVSKGGDGFVIINGKLVKIGPRGPKWKLFQALAALSENTFDARKTAALGKVIEEIGVELAATR